MTAAPTRATALQLVLALATPLLLAAGCGREKEASSATPAKKGTVRALDEQAAGDVVITPPGKAYAAGQVSAPGTVSGTVTMKSAPSPLAPVSAGRDSTVCGATIPDSSLQRASNGGLGNAVVWLDGVRTGKALPLERRLEVESDRCFLTPRVQGAVVGSAINVLGHDDFRQHLRFVVAGEDEPRATVLLGRDEQVIPTNLPAGKPGLVVVHDADHPWVRGYLAVFDHPYFAVTKPDGSFSIQGVPPGKYRLVTWHERTGRKEEPVEVGANGAVKLNVELSAR